MNLRIGYYISYFKLMYLFRFEMERLLCDLPELVWDNILFYLPDQDLYKVTIMLPEMLKFCQVEWIVNEFKDENSFECKICMCRFRAATILGAHYGLAHPIPIEEQLRRFFSLEG